MNLSRLLVLIFIFNAQFSFSQQAGVRGIITDRQSKAPIAYTSVALLNANDSSLVNGVITKDNGTFEFKQVEPGKYLLKAAFIGYNTLWTPAFTVAKAEQYNLGTLMLSPGEQVLNEVKVSGQKINSLNKIDKQTYRADQFESARGGTAVDVLKNLPAVTVTGEGDISVRGSKGFLVLLNGKPVLTDAHTVLSQLPANSLQSIELLTSPSAKYDPDGKAGIINIVTKKGANDGFTLATNIQGGLPSTDDHNNKEKPQRFGGDATINYRAGKWDVSVSGNYLRADVAGYREGDVYTKNFAANTITRFPSNGERSFDKYNYGGRAALTFAADASNTFSAAFLMSYRFQSRRADLFYDNSTADINTGNILKSTNYYNSNLQTKEGNFSLANFDYTHTFSNKSYLSLSALYEHANLYGDTRNLNISKPDAADTIQYVYNPYKNPINGYRLKLDYAIEIGKDKLESGYQFRYDTQDGQFDYLVKPATSQPDAARFRGNAKAKNAINSLYIQYGGKRSKLEYTAGLRYEYATRRVDLSYNPVPYKLDLYNLFPSVNLLYTFATGWQAKAGYSKRVQRTTNFELNPIPEREHSETLEQGDPNLLPEFVDLAELGLIRTFDKGSFFTTLYYQGIKNPIQRVNSVYADTILNRVFTNAGHARSFGVEAGTNLQLAKWWNLYIGANLYNYKINGQLNIIGVTSNTANSNWVYSLNVNTGFNLSKTWALQANANYLSRRPTAQGEDSRFFVPNAALKKTLLNGRMAATLQWQNIDLGWNQINRQRITTSGSNFYTTTNYIYETNVFMLNLSFNLNKLTGKSKLPSSEFGDKEF